MKTLSEELSLNNVPSANSGSKGLQDAHPWPVDAEYNFAMIVVVRDVLMEDVQVQAGSKKNERNAIKQDEFEQVFCIPC